MHEIEKSTHANFHYNRKIYGMNIQRHFFLSFLNKHNSILIAVQLQQILVTGPELVELH